MCEVVPDKAHLVNGIFPSKGWLYEKQLSCAFVLDGRIQN